MAQNIDDERQARCTKAAAIALGDWFQAAGILRKPIGSLSYEELSAAATAAISGWLVADSRERAMNDLRQSQGSTSPTLI